MLIVAPSLLTDSGRHMLPDTQHIIRPPISNIIFPNHLLTLPFYTYSDCFSSLAYIWRYFHHNHYKNWIEASWDFSSEWIFFHLELLARRDQDKNTISLSFLFEVISELNIVMELISSDVSLNISRLLADIRKALVSSGCLPSEIGIRVRSQDSDTLVLDGKVVKRHGWRTTVNFFL